MNIKKQIPIAAISVKSSNPGISQGSSPIVRGGVVVSSTAGGVIGGLVLPPDADAGGKCKLQVAFVADSVFSCLPDI